MLYFLEKIIKICIRVHITNQTKKIQELVNGLKKKAKLKSLYYKFDLILSEIYVQSTPNLLESLQNTSLGLGAPKNISSESPPKTFSETVTLLKDNYAKNFMENLDFFCYDHQPDNNFTNDKIGYNERLNFYIKTALEFEYLKVSQKSPFPLFHELKSSKKNLLRKIFGKEQFFKNKSLAIFVRKFNQIFEKKCPKFFELVKRFNQPQYRNNLADIGTSDNSILENLFEKFEEEEITNSVKKWEYL